MDVLVIDDDQASREGLVRVLERSGFMVAAVENGLAAIAELQQRGYQAIVCDIAMPFMDGIKFYRQLESEDPKLAARVVFVTGYAAHPVVQKFIRECERPVLTKPYEIDELVAAVRHTFEQRGT